MAPTQRRSGARLTDLLQGLDAQRTPLEAEGQPRRAHTGAADIMPRPHPLAQDLATMRAMTVPVFDGGDVLTPAPLPDPAVGPGEVIVDVVCAAVGFADVLMRRGAFPLPRPQMPGLSIAGHVRALGASVTGLTVGQAVAAFTGPPGMGGYATSVRVSAALVVPLDTADGDVPLDKAAAAIVNGPTAYLALVDLGSLQPGDAVVVQGAAGALGSMTARLARHLGADPLIGVVSSAARRASAMSLGYTHVLLASEDIASQVRALTGGRGADIVVDPVGGPLRRVSLAALRPLGRLIAVGQASFEAEEPVATRDLWLGSHAVLGLNLGALAAAEPRRFQRAARAVFALIARGAVPIDVGDVLPLSAAAEAHRRLARRAVPGTVLLRAGA
jgi:NADPH2:quinone reductase